MMKRFVTAAVAAAVLLPLGAQAEQRNPPSRVWVPGTEIRNWHGHQLVLLPPWQSEQAALGREDTTGHIP
jgi:hypothetical protein